MTSVRNQDDTYTAKFPSGYGRYALGPVRPVTPPGRGWLYAAGELSMTAEDLAKWDIARINRSTLPADDWAAQETMVKLNDGKDSGYGLGVFIRTEPRRAITHGGEAVGFLSANNVYPDERAAVDVLTNTWSAGAYNRIARDIAKVILPAPGAGCRPGRAGDPRPQRLRPVARRAARPQPADDQREFLFHPAGHRRLSARASARSASRRRSSLRQAGAARRLRDPGLHDQISGPHAGPLDLLRARSQRPHRAVPRVARRMS